MHEILSLLRAKILTYKNTASRGGKRKLLRYGIFLTMGLLFWLGTFLIFYKVLSYFSGIQVIGTLLSAKLLSMVFLAFFSLLIFSNVITALSTFFLSDDLQLLNMALSDEQMAIRRLATVYLGMIDNEQVVPYLEKAINDKNPSVRRTAGDCMSDLGFSLFEPAMIHALKDKNKLVRWRAAMFLFESGTDNALPALKAANEDTEFEVKLQINMAIARIEEGEEAKGSVWKQMTESRK